MNPKKRSDQRRSAWLYLCFVLVTSFFTYFYRYDYPQAVFWDEPYHIAAAEKYLHGVYFMEQHPPLGKLLVALGEKILHPNPDTSLDIGTDYARNFPEGFSFAGFRLMPTLLAWLTAPLLYFIFLYFTRSPILAALLSFLYIFDNAEIVHSRGAMVDSPLTFFGMLCFLLFLHIQDSRKPGIRKHSLLSLAFGVTFGLAMTTKLVGLIFILLIPAVLWRLYPEWKRIVLFCFWSWIGFSVAFVTVWQIHFSLGSTIVPTLPDEGNYQASPEYREIISQGKNTSLLSFPVMIRDSMKYVTFYNRGVPRLDLCKPDENGSPAFYWPLGGRSINYRWEKVADDRYRYLYLVANPVAWLCGILGVVLSAFFLLSSVLLPSKERRLKHGFAMFLVLGMYSGYMITIMLLSRVMYLYHYFIPLLFSFILFGLALENISVIGSYVVTAGRKLVGMAIVGLLIFFAFQFIRPLSYYQPISDAGVEKRGILGLWEVTCVRCTKTNSLAVPFQRNQ